MSESILTNSVSSTKFGRDTTNKTILDLVYPIGTVYTYSGKTLTQDSICPIQSMLGGTWKLLNQTEDRTDYCYNTYLRSTNSASTVRKVTIPNSSMDYNNIYTFTLSSSNLPNHTHSTNSASQTSDEYSATDISHNHKLSAGDLGIPSSWLTSDTYHRHTNFQRLLVPDANQSWKFNGDEDGADLLYVKLSLPALKSSPDGQNLGSMTGSYATAHQEELIYSYKHSSGTYKSYIHAYSSIKNPSIANNEAATNAESKSYPPDLTSYATNSPAGPGVSQMDDKLGFSTGINVGGTIKWGYEYFKSVVPNSSHYHTISTMQLLNTSHDFRHQHKYTVSATLNNTGSSSEIYLPIRPKTYNTIMWERIS